MNAIILNSLSNLMYIMFEMLFVRVKRHCKSKSISRLSYNNLLKKKQKKLFDHIFLRERAFKNLSCLISISLSTYSNVYHPLEKSSY